MDESTHRHIDALIETEELTWRDILYEVIRGMDPWDINISELATRYSQKVGRMREMNFRIPANVLLVSSVLLRMKADLLNPREEDPLAELAHSFNFIFDSDSKVFDLTALTEGNGEDDEMPLLIKPNRVPKRRITAVELIEAIQKALEEKGERKMRLVEEEDGRKTLVISTDIDITELIEETYGRITRILSGREFVLFSELAGTKDEIVRVFMPLLHLSNMRRVSMQQERIFEEIYITPKTRHTVT